jgi:hypothetical protein
MNIGTHHWVPGRTTGILSVQFVKLSFEGFPVYEPQQLVQPVGLSLLFDQRQRGIDERKLRIVFADHVPLPDVGKDYFAMTFSAIPS